MALYSNWVSAKPDSLQKKIGLTGTVVDSGDGVTHVIPVVGSFRDFLSGFSVMDT